MNEIWFTSLLYGAGLLGLMVINAFLVACEVSMVKLRYSLTQNQTAVNEVASRRRLSFLLNQPESAALVIRFGIMSTTVALGLLLLAFLQLAVNWLPFFDSRGGSVLAVLVCFLIAVSLISVLGFHVPRGVALAHPFPALRFTSWFVTGFVLVLLPWYKTLRAFARWISKLFRLPHQPDLNVLDYEVQIRALGEDDGQYSKYLVSILRNALIMRDLDVSDVILPRNQIQWLDTNERTAESLQFARETGHTRFPLCDGDLDRCTGLVHIKDLFRYRGDLVSADLRRLARRIYSFPHDTSLEDALQTLLTRKIHMALVTDDFGGTLGVITLESILEELVGDIDDEFDTPEAEQVRQLGEDEFQIDGLTPVHEVEEALGIDFDNDEVSTFGGLIVSELGRIPAPGEEIVLDEPALSVSVREVDEKRLISAKVKRIPAEDGNAN